MATDHLTPSVYLRITSSGEFITNRWKNEAECLKLVQKDKINPLLFFPNDQKDYVPPLAKAVCDRCEVRLQCLCLAIYTNEREGVWGGHSPKAVRRIAKRMRGVLARR